MEINKFFLRSALALLALLLAVGCGRSLKGETLTELRAQLAGTEVMCPGESAPLIVTASLEDGEVRATRGAGGGRLRWNEFNVRPAAAGFENGTIRVDGDPRVTAAEPA